MSLKVSSQFFVSFTLIHQKFANHYLTRSHLNVKAHILPLIHVRNSHRSRWECCTEINDRIWTSRLDHLSHGSSSHWHTEIWEDWEKKKTKRHKAESFQDKLHGSLVKLAVNWMLTVVLQKWKGGGVDGTVKLPTSAVMHLAGISCLTIQVSRTCFITASVLAWHRLLNQVSFPSSDAWIGNQKILYKIYFLFKTCMTLSIL